MASACAPSPRKVVLHKWYGMRTPEGFQLIAQGNALG